MDNTMNDTTVKISLALQGIASVIDDHLKELSGGQRIGFSFIVFTEGRASYVSNVDRPTVVREIKGLLADWEAGMPDVPAHKVQ